MTDDEPLNVLFLCTGNSARSIIAEAIVEPRGTRPVPGLLRRLDAEGRSQSAGARLLHSLHYPTEGLRSKSWDEFAAPGRAEARFRVHRLRQRGRRGLPDLARPTDDRALGHARPGGRATGSPAEIALAFADTYRMLNNRITLFMNLPMASLDRLSLQRRLDGSASGARRRRNGMSEAPADASLEPPLRLRRRPAARGGGVGHGAVCWRSSSAQGSWASGWRAETSPSRCSATRWRPARAGRADHHLRTDLRRALQPRRHAGVRDPARDRLAHGAGLCRRADRGRRSLGVWPAHAMFAEPILQVSTKLRDGPAQVFSEFVATFGLIAAILGSLRFRPDATPVASASTSPPPTGSPPRPRSPTRR